jgi:hypothetical protein
MRLFILFLVSISTPLAWSDSNIKLLEGVEWKADCSKMASESPASGKKVSIKRIRSTYMLSGDELTWKVQSFSDDKCKTINEENRYKLKCSFADSDEYANCEQTKWEFSKNQKDWQSKPLVDFTGNSNILKLRVRAVELKNKNIQLTTLAEGEEPSVEVLSK